MSALYDQVLLEHAKHPRNFGPLPGANGTGHGTNPLCGDEITVRVRTQDGAVAEIACEGAGCAVCLGSASMMTVATKGQPLPEVRALMHRVRALLGGNPPANMGDLAALSKVAGHPARVGCATLPWTALEAALRAL